MTLFEKFDHVKNDHSIFKMVNFSSKCKKRGLTIANVATKLPASAPASAPPPPINTVQNERKLVAWTSIQQERWQGELEVEGEIPLWLVKNNLAFYIS